MGLFRSEDMTLCSLYLQADTAFAIIARLGELGLVQFRDLNTNVQAFQRKFVNEVRRCDEMERQIRYFEHEVSEEKNVHINESEMIPEAPAPRDLIDLEAMFERLESELKEFNNNISALRQNRASLKEIQYVLSHTDDFFIGTTSSDYEMISQGPGFTDSGRLSYVTGVMLQERVQPFMRLLWFACHGNVLVRYSAIDQWIEDPLSAGSVVKKVVFVVFFQGEQLRIKVKKICDGFRATLYPCPESAQERREMAASVQQRLDDMQMVIIRSEDQRQIVLTTLARNLWSWRIKVTKVKAIYYILNMLHTEGQNFVGECWLPTADMGQVQMILNKASDGVAAPSLLHPVQTNESLPTYFRTNKFTFAFQHIVNAYGQANYKEMNPAPFGFITFPFLFGVMFGDVGHGFLLFLFGLWMVLSEKRLFAAAAKEEMFGILFGGRYIIMLMGLFAMYSGFMYNEVFAMPLNIFGSCWNVIYDNNTMFLQESQMLDPADPRVYDGSPYPFGLDPAWNMALNTITFTNTYKEKLSVIMGVSQMFLGVMLSIFNHMYFHQRLNIFCEFIPQVLFLLCMFGYLVILIIVKWIVFTPAESAVAPNLLIGYINMFLMNYDENSGSPLWYPGQKGLQIFLVIISLVSALWMLVTKPLIIKLRQNRGSNGLCVMVNAETNSASDFVTDDTAQILPEIGQSNESLSANVANNVKHEEHEDFTELCIHQAIHTIEFCLGCVSHTASYLRLWALSLAHSQLSEVLWTMVLRLGFSMSMPMGGFVIAILFLPFSTLTVGILLGMEGLSAFLHTLRLHWVEFQSKFYKGEGFAFQPFSFKEILELHEV